MTNQSRKKQSSKPVILVVVLAFLLIAVTGMLVIFAMMRDTSVSDVPATLNPAAGETLTTSVTVSPASGRKVCLQEYDADEEKWVTKAETRAGSGSQETVELTFPDGWDDTVRSKWRVYLPATWRATRYEGTTIKLTVKNIASVKLTAKAAVVLAVSGKTVLYDRNMNERLPNASTTKLVSVMVSMDHADGTETVTFSKKAAKTQDGNLYKEAGDQFRMSDLWKAMLVMSSNEASVAVAEGSLGSVSAFVKAMNEKAVSLGCKNTHFVNPHGLDADGHYSSAYDLALIDIAAMKYEKIPPILKIVKTEINALNTSDRLNYLTTTNKLLSEKYEGHLGGKTGHTDNAGDCFVGMYEYKGKRYVTCVLNSDNRWSDTKKLYAYIRKYYAG